MINYIQMRWLEDLPHAEDQRVCFDDFSLAGEGEVSSVLLVLVQLAQMRDNVVGGKAHPDGKQLK